MNKLIKNAGLLDRKIEILLEMLCQIVKFIKNLKGLFHNRL